MARYRGGMVSCSCFAAALVVTSVTGTMVGVQGVGLAESCMLSFARTGAERALDRQKLPLIVEDEVPLLVINSRLDPLRLAGGGKQVSCAHTNGMYQEGRHLTGGTHSISAQCSSRPSRKSECVRVMSSASSYACK